MRYVFLSWAIMFFFGFGIIPVFAQDSFYIQDEAGSGTATGAFGNYDTTCYFGQYFTATTSIDVLELRSTLALTGSPTDGVYAYLATISGSTLTEIATSTNIITSVNSSYVMKTWEFDTTLNFETPTNIYFGLRRVGSYNSTNYYRFGRLSAGSLDTWSFRCSNNQQYGGYTYDYMSLLVQNTPVETACPDGYECYTIEEMATATQAIASSTEAIYTVGYTIQLFLGMYLLLLFGWFGYTFTRKFIW